MEKVYIFKPYYYYTYRLKYVRWGSMKELDEDEYFEDDENIYSEDVRELLLEDGELSPEEAGFMQGYDEAA